MLFRRTEATRFFFFFHAPPPQVWCGSGEMEEAACLALHRLWSLTAAPTLLQDGTHWNETHRLNYFSRQPGCILDLSIQRQTFLFKILFLPDTWFLPTSSGFSVFLSGSCGVVFVCVLGMEGPVTQENQITIMQLSPARLGKRVLHELLLCWLITHDLS